MKVISYSLPLLLAVASLGIAVTEPDAKDCGAFVAFTFVCAFMALWNLANRNDK